MCDYSSILQRDQAHEEQQFAVIISIVQKQRNLTGIGRLNIMAQGSRFESSKPDLNELAAIDILFVKNDTVRGIQMGEASACSV